MIKTKNLALDNVPWLGIIMQSSLLKRLKKIWIFYIFLIPAFVLVAIFAYAPLVGLIMAFQDYSASLGWFHSPFVGLKHFQAVVNDRLFVNVIQNTLIISISLFVFSFPAPILLALCLDSIRAPFFKRISQTISYLPHFISWVVLAGLVYRILDVETGIVNQIIKLFGGTPVPFVRIGQLFHGLLVIVSVLKEVGWSSIIYLAAIASIDPELFDAADIDGASRLRKSIYITLPCIAPTIATMLILRMGTFINVNFDMVFNMRNDMIMSYANVLATFVYDRGVLRGQFSYGTAVGLLQSVVTVSLVVISLKLSKKITGETIVV